MKPQVEFDPVPPVTSTAVGPVKGEPASNGAPHVNGSSSRPRAAALVSRPKYNLQWWQLAAAAGRHWVWLLVAVAAFAALGAALGRKIWATAYTATAQIVRYDTPDPQIFQPRPINPATLVGMVNSVELRSRAGARLTPAVSAAEVGDRVKVQPVLSSELVNISFTGANPALASAQANLYAEEAVKFTQELQARDARDAASYLRHQLTQTEQEIVAVNTQFRGLGPLATSSIAATGSSPLQSRLEEARMELTDLQSRYTDLHPLVQMQVARVAALEKQAGVPSATAGAAAAPVATAAIGEAELLREKISALEAQRRTIATRLQITELLAQNPPGHFQIFSRANAERATLNDPAAKIALLSVFFGLCGLIVGVMGAMTDEVLDRRLRTPDDVRRVTQLPVLARLGPIEKMSAEEKARWGFRTWTALQSRLSPTPNQGLVCGITCSTPGEGRSIWIKLLADAANQCGFRVVVITTRELLDQTDASRRNEGRPAPAETAAHVRFRTSKGAPKSAEPVLIHETILSDDLLSTPEEAVERMLAPEGTAIVHIPLPGWVWNLEHRKEWLASLESWGNRENVVILIELPPASSAESVLLAQNLPNVVWLSDSTSADAAETVRQIETLRLARCNLVGAVMNRSNGTPLNERFARWMPAPAMAALALGCFAATPAGLSAQAEAAAPATFSIVSPGQRANWQQHLTLGPGDVLRIALYGEPNATRAEVAVQPDGRISFLEARDVVANGLTIDQLRAELDRALGNFRRSARTMISPVTFRSKKYHMLGLVSQKGAFTLDRPMTIVEAVARARGFETSATSGDVMDLADLRHAFLVRNGERKQVDFAKLFTAGDLTQNIAVEPGDYFYFPPANLREVYVLGEVAHPGPAMLTEQSTSLRAVATRGGFTQKAWRGRVLVVRGSLSEPNPIVVNLSEVLQGRAADVQLEPHDIVYVSARPWWKAEDLLDEAASAFTQAFVVYWTSDKVVPVVPLQ